MARTLLTLNPRSLAGPHSGLKSKDVVVVPNILRNMRRGAEGGEHHRR